MSTETKIERLLCDLTQEEHAKRGEELAAKVDELRLLEEEKKNTASRYGERIKKVKSEICDLAIVVSQCAEERDVEVYGVFDYERGVCDVVRTDTGCVIRSRPIAEVERQIKIDESLRMQTERILPAE